MKTITVFILCVLIGNLTLAQEESNSHEESEKKHSIALFVNHTQVMESLDTEGKTKWIALPSWGLDYNYEFSEKWGVGLHADMILEKFIVKRSGSSEENNELERNRPIAVAALALFKPGKHFSFQLGAGGEFAEGESFFLIRTTVEYGYKFHEDWELLAHISNDLKIEGYNSWSIGLGVARRF